MENIFRWVLAILLGCSLSIASAQTSPQNQSFDVHGACGMCQDRIETAAMQIAGVQSADWSAEAQKLTVRVDQEKFDADQLLRHIASVGHDNEAYKATQEVYNNLHGCCKYREQVSSSSAEGLSFSVNGACGMCQDRIETAAMQIAGVQSADWSAEAQKLTVQVDEEKFDADQLLRHIASVGHDNEAYKATQEVYDNLHNCCKYREQVTAPTAEGVSFGVSGVCGMCQDRIETAALQIAGVQSAEWDIPGQKLTVTVDEESFDADQLLQHIAAIGHDNERYQAPQEAYDGIHECCKYRTMDPHGFEADEAGSKGAQPPTFTDTRTCHDENAVQGMIYERLGGEQIPLVGANVYWIGETQGTYSDDDGHFCLPPSEATEQLVLSYVGYTNDTIDMKGQKMVAITLEEATVLDAVEVSHRRRGTEISFLDAVKTHKIGKKELLKAACCNLAESFETTPAVDVTTTDGVTGTRQIQLLGLAGPNVQIMRENMPHIRGLNALYGLTYVPGSWIQGMQLNLGSGSVANGFESITGQINVEIKKPQQEQKTLINFYANEGGRFEGNLVTNRELNDQWSTSLLLHARTQRTRHDQNGDGFLDMPLGDNFIAMNRWRFYSESGWMGQVGIKGTYVKQTSGLEIFDPERSVAEQGSWGAQMETQRLEGWVKVGKAFPGNPNRSMGFQLSGMTHDQDAFFGMRTYNANQQSFYANYLYEDVIGSSKHKYRVGVSYQFDAFDEFVIDQTYTRSEHVPGVYAEYTHTPNEKWTSVLGIRGDYHNLFGAFITPRLNLRYAASPTAVIRLMAGRGQRTPSIFAENIGLFASNRTFRILSEDPDKPYGLDAEVAWNFGINFTKEWQLASRPLVFGIDYYHTRFQNQIVVDYDQDDRAAFFYNLNGQSFSNSLQVQVDWELLPKLDVRLAYRLNDVQVDYLDIGRLQKPLVARHRGFLNVGYEAPKAWFFDATLNVVGSKRIPISEDNPNRSFREPDSPVYTLVNTQISKKFGEGIRIALGAENLFNFRQQFAINSFENTDSPYFDASLIWGPIFGRNAYVQLDWEF